MPSGSVVAPSSLPLPSRLVRAALLSRVPGVIGARCSLPSEYLKPSRAVVPLGAAESTILFVEKTPQFGHHHSGRIPHYDKLIQPAHQLSLPQPSIVIFSSCFCLRCTRRCVCDVSVRCHCHLSQAVACTHLTNSGRRLGLKNRIRINKLGCIVFSNAAWFTSYEKDTCRMQKCVPLIPSTHQLKWRPREASKKERKGEDTHSSSHIHPMVPKDT